MTYGKVLCVWLLNISGKKGSIKVYDKFKIRKGYKNYNLRNPNDVEQQ